MSESVLNLGVDCPEDELALEQAIETFTKWRIETSGTGWMERDLPDLIVKTVWDAHGQLQKLLIFAESKWKEVFMAIWLELRPSIAAA